HEGLGPVDVAVGGAGGDAGDLVARMIPHVRRVLPRESDIVLGLHVAAAAPGLVADAEVGHLPRLVTAVGPAQGRHRRVVGAGEVLDPLAHLHDRAGADVPVDVRLGVQQLHEVHELMGAEGAVLDHVAPVRVDHAGPLLARADAVAPVVVVGEAAAGPAQVRDLQRTQRLDHVIADATRVRDLGVLAHVEAAVDAAAQVLGEMAVDVPADRVAGAGEVDGDAGRAAADRRRSGPGGGGGSVARGGLARGGCLQAGGEGGGQRASAADGRGALLWSRYEGRLAGQGPGGCRRPVFYRYTLMSRAMSAAAARDIARAAPARGGAAPVQPSPSRSSSRTGGVSPPSSSARTATRCVPRGTGNSTSRISCSAPPLSSVPTSSPSTSTWAR